MVENSIAHKTREEVEVQYIRILKHLNFWTRLWSQTSSLTFLKLQFQMESLACFPLLMLGR